MSARVLLLVALPIAGAITWLAVRERGAAPGAPAELDVLGPAAAPAPSVQVEPVTNADAASMLQSWGQSIASTARRVFSLPQAGQPYADTIAAAEQKYGLPQSLLARILYQESHFRPDIIDGRTRSSAGALGIAQFMPDTAAEWGVQPLDPASAIPGAAKYLRWLYDSLGDWQRAIAAYNWGIGNVERRGLDAAPSETRAYLRDILSDVDVSAWT